jgi:hypothetical protein
MVTSQYFDLAWILFVYVYISTTSSFIETSLLGYLQVQNKIPSRRLCEEER